MSKSSDPTEVILDAIEHKRRVRILTSTICEYEGILKGMDQTGNCVLEDAVETTTSTRYPSMLLSFTQISLIIPLS